MKDCNNKEIHLNDTVIWFDPDIQPQPYCRECLDKVKLKLLIELSKIDNKRENKQIKS